VRKALGVILLIFVVALIVYALFYSTVKNRSIREVELISEGSIHKIVSMRQIDSLTADLNYYFTIKNKVIHPIRLDSVKIRRKGEIPAG
jgi:hypothetical protein